VNLKVAIGALPHVLVYDNNDLAAPFRQVAIFEEGRRQELNEPVPTWLKPLVR
jgi:hypothetical protein